MQTGADPNLRRGPIRGHPIRVLLVSMALASGLFAIRVALWRPFKLSGEFPKDAYTRVGGVAHVHTTFSDGGGTPAEVAAAAAAAKLSFVFLTDHNNLDAKPFEGYRSGVLVLVGTEISTTAGHILGLGIPDPVFRFSGDAWDGLDDILELGGSSFAAHPTSPLATFRWTGWDMPGAWGIELVNGDTQWRDAGRGRLARTGLLYALNPRYALLGSLNTPTAALSRWDALLAHRNAVGLAGADAHSRVPLWRQKSLRFPSYEALFHLTQNHLLLGRPLTGDFGADSEEVLRALRHGRFYLGIDALAPADGFFFRARESHRTWTMGETVPLSPSLSLEAGGRMPKGTLVRLLKDGRLEAEGEGHIEKAGVEPGVYRVEARVPGWEVPWVLTNPIYVFDEVQAEERERRGLWPHPDSGPSARTVLDSFEGRTSFQQEADPESTIEAGVLDRGAGFDGHTAARLRFHLAAPGPGRPFTWCALVNREKRDLSDYQGLVFWVRGDGVYRIWVQVRDENPRSADEGTEWWFASVRTSLDWRRVAIPFRRFRSINPKSDGRLDLDKVRQLVFMVDGGAVKVGTRGTIWLDDVGVY